MGPFRILKLLHIGRFFENATTYIDPDESALQGAGADAEPHARYHRRIVASAIVLGVVGLITGTAVLIMSLQERSRARDSVSRSDNDDIAIIFSPVLFCAGGLLCGAALACAFAPRSFLTGPMGSKWMKLIGTTEVGAARLVCGFLALFFLAMTVGLFIAFWYQIRSA